MIYVDETGINSNCYRKYEWSEKGKDSNKNNRKQIVNTTLTAAISRRGIMLYQFQKGAQN